MGKYDVCHRASIVATTTPASPHAVIPSVNCTRSMSCTRSVPWRAVWNYKMMDFGLVDADGKVVDPEYLRILTDAK